MEFLQNQRETFTFEQNEQGFSKHFIKKSNPLGIYQLMQMGIMANQSESYFMKVNFSEVYFLDNFNSSIYDKEKIRNKLLPYERIDDSLDLKYSLAIPIYIIPCEPWQRINKTIE